MQPTQTEKVFPQGIMFKVPREGSPDFIKGSVSIKKGEFIAWLQQLDSTDEWANLDLKKSKGGKLYFDLNDWKPEGEVKLQAEAVSVPAETPTQVDIQASYVPF